MRKLFLIIIGTMLCLFLSASNNDIPEIEMVVVEGGTFTMGFDADEAEHTYETPKHEVTLHDYKIGKYEVTQALWESVMGDNPSIFKGSNLHVENISWYDIEVFINCLQSSDYYKWRVA